MSLLADLLAVRPDDPLVRWRVADRLDGAASAGVALVTSGRNVAWLGRAARSDERWVTGLGEEPSVVAGLVADISERHEIDGVTVPETAFDVLPAHLRSPAIGHWCLWTRAATPAGLEADGAIALDPADARILPLLAHSASAHVFPGDPSIVAWAGVEVHGELASVAACQRSASGSAHIVSVCTDPRFRGRGLAEHCCSLLMLQAIAEGAPMIDLEMYVANDSGRALYSRLGFEECGRYMSGLLRP